MPLFVAVTVTVTYAHSATAGKTSLMYVCLYVWVLWRLKLLGSCAPGLGIQYCQYQRVGCIPYSREIQFRGGGKPCSKGRENAALQRYPATLSHLPGIEAKPLTH